MGAFSGGTDPLPFFVMAYGVGAVGLFGFAAWVILERRKLRALLTAVKRTP